MLNVFNYVNAALFMPKVCSALQRDAKTLLHTKAAR